MKTILVTGGAGYIGNFVVEELLIRGYKVKALDSLLYGALGLNRLSEDPNLEIIQGDITSRDTVAQSLKEVDGIIALAAIVGDPACTVDIDYTKKVNYESTVLLVEEMKKSGVNRVVFASSCSVYGSSENIKYLTEDSELNPVSLYAQTRIWSEEFLLSQLMYISPVILRLSTVFGLSRRMRFDLAINIMTAKAVQDKIVDVFGGNQWRPFVHVRDVAKAFILALEADDKLVKGQIFNVGSTDSNYQLEDIAKIISEEVDGTRINNASNIIDQRNYNVIFDKIHKKLNFKTDFSVRDGVREIRDFMTKNPVNMSDKVYSNYQTINKLLKEQRFIPFAVPDVGDEEKNEIIKTIDSGWLSTGPKTKLFEEKVKEYFGDSELEVIAVNSCTAGLHLQLLAAGIGPSDEVITTPLTFCATVNTILYTGAKPVLVDVDPVTYNLDIDKIEDHITSRTKAIVPVYYAGQAVDHDKLKELAEKHGLLILADAAHAMGAKYKDKYCGTYENSAAFSFYATKNFTTGEGGLVTTHNKQWAERMRRLLSHGMNKDAWKRFSEAGSWYYEIADLGYKYNFTDIQAAFGVHQIEKIDFFNQLRRQYSKIYDNAFENELIKIPKEVDHAYHIRHLYPIILDVDKLKLSRDQFIQEMKNHKIGTSVHYVPINHHPYYQEKLSIKPGDFPVSDLLYRGMISLPLYTKLSIDDIKRVANTVLEILNTERE